MNSLINSTSVPLLEDGVWFGSVESTKNYNTISFTFVANRTADIRVQHSGDGENFDVEDGFNISGNKPTFRQVHVKGVYFRMKVTNSGGADMAHMRLHTRLLANTVPDNINVQLDTNDLMHVQLADGNGELIPILDVNVKNTTLCYRNLDVNITSSQIGSGAVKLHSLYVHNNSYSTKYIKLYNSASATNSDTPVMTLVILSTMYSGNVANITFTTPVLFDTALCIRGTTNLADDDNTSTSSNDIVLNATYSSY
jgi:hypothetical protein